MNDANVELEFNATLSLRFRFHASKQIYDLRSSGNSIPFYAIVLSLSRILVFNGNVWMLLALIDVKSLRNCYLIGFMFVFFSRNGVLLELNRRGWNNCPYWFLGVRFLDRISTHWACFCVFSLITNDFLDQDFELD